MGDSVHPGQNFIPNLVCKFDVVMGNLAVNSVLATHRSTSKFRFFETLFTIFFAMVIKQSLAEGSEGCEQHHSVVPR